MGRGAREQRGAVAGRYEGRGDREAGKAGEGNRGGQRTWDQMAGGAGGGIHKHKY